MNNLFQLTVRKIRKFCVGQAGATSVEYAIMLALILLACFAAIRVTGDESGSLWTSNSEVISTSMTR